MHEANCSHAHPSYLQYCEGEGRSHPCPDIFTRERHDRDNRPPSLLPCPFLKAELKSFSTGVQRPPIPPPSGKEREKKGERKPRTVVNATRWPPPRLSVNTDANRPAAAEILLGFLPARATLPPLFCSHVRRDASRPISTVCNFFALRPRILLTFRTGERYWGADRWGSNEIGLISMLNFQ